MDVLLDVEIHNAEKNILLQLIHLMKNSQNKNYLLSQKPLNVFLIYDFNVNTAYKYITEENNTFVSKQIIPKVYNQIRRVISKYLKI